LELPDDTPVPVSPSPIPRIPYCASVPIADVISLVAWSEYPLVLNVTFMWSSSCAVTEALAGPADGLPKFKLKFRLAGPPLNSIPPTGSNTYILNII
jgi:hypothetical protein